MYFRLLLQRIRGNLIKFFDQIVPLVESSTPCVRYFTIKKERNSIFRKKGLTLLPINDLWQNDRLSKIHNINSGISKRWQNISIEVLVFRRPFGTPEVISTGQWFTLGTNNRRSELQLKLFHN